MHHWDMCDTQPSDASKLYYNHSQSVLNIINLNHGGKKTSHKNWAAKSWVDHVAKLQSHLRAVCVSAVNLKENGA